MPIPGPWTLDPHSAGHDICTVWNIAPRKGYDGPFQTWANIRPAEPYSYYSMKDREEAALVMVAAPVLLEALKAIHGALVSLAQDGLICVKDGQHADEIEAKIAQAEAAIDLAKPLTP